MSTHCSITICKGKGRKTVLRSVYCHNDGYLQYTGLILLEEYSSEEKVEKLVSLGDLSSLGESIEPNPERVHTFDERQEDVCVFYHRDRGEDWEYVKTLECKTIEEVYERNKQEYNYLFKDGKWYWNTWEKKYWVGEEPIWKELTEWDCRM